MSRSTLALIGLLAVPSLGLFGLPRPVPPASSLADHDRRLRRVAQLPQPAPAWPDQARMTFDRVPRPLLHGERLFHGCTRTDSVVARERDTGEEIWRFTTAGPVRLPLASWNDLVFAASDDGYLYALEAATGELRWKVRGGPSDRKILGNERLISTWPARGGPVVAADEGAPTVYFAAGIWPFMGIFLHAIDAETGAIRWTCDGEGARYMKQPHNADSFAGVAPQGRLVLAGDLLLAPGGRSVPAAYNRHTGEFVHFRLAEHGKTGNSEVQSNGVVYTCGDSVFAADTGKLLAKLGDPAFLTEDRLYAWDRGVLSEYDLINVPVHRDEKDKPVWSPRRLAWVAMPVAPLALGGSSTRLFVGLADRVVGYRLPLWERQGRPIWQARVADPVLSLTADADDLVAVTRQGSLYTFGQTYDPIPAFQRSPSVVWRESPEVTLLANRLLERTSQREGYALLVGAERADLARALTRLSGLRVVLLVADEDDVAELRTQAQEAGVPGDRLTFLHGTPATLDLPAYFANLIVADARNPLDRLFACLRPYGGTLVLPTGQVAALGAFQPTLPAQETDVGSILVRQGALPGAGNWTHEQGDAAGTRLSRDRIIKAPLGLLWFGGPSTEGILPRHGHGPQPQVIDGRTIIEGMDLIRAVDIYTGRLLWETSLPGVGQQYDNLAHQPGANASGGNFVSLSHGIYVAHGKHCLRLDPATGKEIERFTVPALPGVGSNPLWSYINVSDDYLVGGTLPDNPTASKTKPVAPSASKLLFVMDRRTGRLLWSSLARSDGWRHNAICLGGGRLYAIDRPSLAAGFSKVEERLPGEARLVAFDLASGKERWSAARIVFGTSLAYSAEHDVLIEAGRVARDTLADEPKGMRAYVGATGKVRWFEPEFGGPCMLRGDQVFFGSNAAGKACSVLTGVPIKRPDPLTGEPVEWTWARHYGCNTPMASEHLLTFRSGSAGFYDLCQESGTGNLGGFRSGCTNNLVAAGGLLVVPDYTRTCTCSYQNQCSVALVPMAEADLWTFQGGGSEIKGVVRRIGLLLGAPGNRKADNGTLWLEYPASGSPGPKPNVAITPPVTYFRRHPSQIVGQPAWIGAAGAIGLENLTVQLGPKGLKPRRCTVRLYFVEPEPIEVGERIFSVAINGKEVEANLDVRAEAGTALKLVCREYNSVAIADSLTLTFKPTSRTHPAVLSGVEVVQE